MKDSIRKGLILFFAAVFGVSAWQTYGIVKEYRSGAEHYSDLKQYVSHENTEPATVEQEILPDELPEKVQTDQTNWPEIDFDALCQINPDIVGWLYIEGTQIDYPIVQGRDNDYYLNHQFDGSYNSAGCLFLDAFGDRDFAGQNNIVYGHYMKNGTMFSALQQYKQQDFYDTHPTALLITPSGRYMIQFFSGYVANTADVAWELDFSETDFGSWISGQREKSCFASETVPTLNDRVLTLSTCSYEFNNARFVLHGILCDGGAD